MHRPPPSAGSRSVPNRRSLFRRVTLVALAAAALLTIGTIGSAQDKPGAPVSPPSQTPAAAETKPADQAAAANKPAEYIGSEMCGACHEDISKAFAKNPHHVVDTTKRYGF